jgi:hypothetical protein
MRKASVVLLALVLSGCSSWLPDYSAEDSGYRLQLLRPLLVPPENARVFVQEGKMLPSLSFNQYQISCSFEVRQLSEQPQTIEVDTFVVNRVQQMQEEVASWRTVKLASLQLSDAAVDSSPPDIFRGWHFWLHSDKQPNVLRMTCRGVFAEPWEAEPPTLAEIRQALGDIASLKTGTEVIVPGSF